MGVFVFFLFSILDVGSVRVVRSFVVVWGIGCFLFFVVLFFVCGFGFMGLCGVLVIIC